mgnify:CR=1 FL=1
MSETNTNTSTNTTANEVVENNIQAEILCILQGTVQGAAAVLVLHGKEENLERETIEYLEEYTRNLVAQGLTPDACKNLFDQLNGAEGNVVHNVATYLLGSVLENLAK